MGRRSGRFARGVVRLGLLLGAVAGAWIGYDTATSGAAYAADSPPATLVEGPVEGVTGLLRSSLSPVVADPPPARRPGGPSTSPGTAAPTLPGGSGGGSDKRHTTTPSRQQADAGPVRRHRPASGDAAGQRRGAASPTERAVPRSTDRKAGARLSPASQAVPSPATARLRDRLSAPAAHTLEPVAGPLHDRVVTPAAHVLEPGTGPLRDRLIGPVAGVLQPVITPVSGVLAPVLVPVNRGARPLRGFLNPVLKPFDPLLRPVAPVGSSAGREPPVAAPPADEPTAPTALTAPSAGSGPSETATAGASSVAHTHPYGRTAATRSSDAARPALRSPAPDRYRPAHPAPAGAPSHTGTSGGLQLGEADTGLAAWVPPTTGCLRCRPTSPDAMPSRSPRPGSRPA
ncbi:hypothetical protein [Micromonospora halophytica]|uniref:Uncharacterized protein n=1 Tax=Micromonospora halophytica TaxID=47864 RepID=A0A1C5I9M1_9ACTN|nr:hypothetical protein [Micromonospora halophytica]SCG54964.1 hypothetical protein GA0070560_10977 [Micromonospora halophytica]